MKLRSAIAAALLTASLAPGHAHADDGLGDGEGAAIALSGVVYVGPSVGFALADLVNLPSDHVRTMTYGIAETAYNGIAAAGLAAFAATRPSTYPTDSRNEVYLLAGANAALMAHGIYTIVQNARGASEQPLLHVGSARANVTLAPVSDGRTARTGLAMVGTF